jgi:hypothetical protein
MYKSGECDRSWSKMDKKNFTIGSLKYWAKQDNPKNYEDIILSSLTKCVYECVGSDGSHYDLVVITSKIMKDRIVYDGKAKCWYNIIMYVIIGKQKCMQCDELKNLLDEKGIQYSYLDMTKMLHKPMTI